MERQRHGPGIARILLGAPRTGALSPEDTRCAGQPVTQRTFLMQEEAEKRLSGVCAGVRTRCSDAQVPMRQGPQAIGACRPVDLRLAAGRGIRQPSQRDVRWPASRRLTCATELCPTQAFVMGPLLSFLVRVSIHTIDVKHHVKDAQNEMVPKT
jgi:hypothetical protein